MIIDSCSFGRIKIDGKEYSRDVIIYPDQVNDNWWRRRGHELCVDDLGDILGEKPKVLIVGTGYYGFMKILSETTQLLKEKRIELIEGKTKDMCKEFNEVSTSRKTIAVLHLTC